ncbi:acyltransferase [Pseudomonas sp. TMW22090]|uniref:acyltransferase family protein n=1 Tax=Pseudomonas sp. TMW22090 TaxID=2506434 RepID=UPI001F110B48|nr:acyltransferase [Pseudomonas sp. TMW22090]MCH4880314.1 acyltransferase [Pseudomonas sp. TMW22090]
MNDTAKKSRITPIDGLRGFAVLVVFVYHTLGIPLSGDIGVDIFFTMSGFLISSQIFNEIKRTNTINIVKFYLNRIVRLIPAFLAVCVLYLAIYYCFGKYSYPANETADMTSMLSMIFMANIYLAQDLHPIPFLQHTWTLAVEWQFYIAWPIILLTLAKCGIKTKSLLAVLICAAIITIWILRMAGDRFLQFDGILLGSLIPLIKDYKFIVGLFKNRFSGLLIFCPAILVMVAFVFHYAQPYTTLPPKTVVSVMTMIAILYFTINYDSIYNNIFDNSLMRYFGKISYGLYLYHYPIAALMYSNGFDSKQLLVVGIIVAIPIADVSWRYLEEPLLKAWARSKSIMREQVIVPSDQTTDDRHSSHTPVAH